jgi:murein DD-endopeptidase MepM/ murein hydrolase activator NlpD
MKHNSPQNQSLSPLTRRPLLRRSVALASSLTVLSSGMVVAQTDSLVDSGAAPEPAPAAAPEPAPAPRMEAPAPEPEPAPRVIAPAPAPRESAPVRRESAPSRRVSAPRPQRDPEPVAAPQRAPAAASDSPKLAAPRVSVPAASPDEIPAQLVDKPPSQAPLAIQRNARFSESGTNTLIDNFGSPANSQRPTVVVTERSTGCQTVVRNGQLAEGSCGGASARGSAARDSSTTAASNRSSRSRSENSVQPLDSGHEERVTALGSQRMRTSSLQATGVPIPMRSRVQAVPTNVAYAPQMTVSDYYSSGAPRPETFQSGQTALLFPLSIPAQITSGFGWRVHPIMGTGRMHSGTDLAAPLGTPVLAAYPGEVALADSVGGYGLMVAIRHENGTQESRYAHLSQIFVQPGDRVERGDVIGLVGSTGFSTGPHLHFEWLHQMPAGWVAVDAGEHLEYALANMIGSIPPTQVASAAESKLEPHAEVEFNFPTDAEIAANLADSKATVEASNPAPNPATIVSESKGATNAARSTVTTASPSSSGSTTTTAANPPRNYGISRGM